MKTDYLKEARKLIEDNFTPVMSVFDEDEYTVKKTLNDVHKDITNVLPAQWIYETDVYEILQDLGFKSFLYTFPAEDGMPEKTLMVYLMDIKTAAL